MIRTGHLLILAALLGLAACGRGDEARESRAAGRPDGAPQAQAARYADANRDGRVTRGEAEADPRLAASFDRYDTNDDDELDRAEFARLEARSAAKREAKDDEERHPSRPRREILLPY